VPALDEVIGRELEALEAAGLRRQMRRWTGAHGPWIQLGGRRLSSFSSNNYLGLAGDERIALGAARALECSGVGAAASRLIAGNHAEHEGLEAELAAFHGAEAALLFNSGFQANVGTIPALVGPEDLILSDQLNHASLIDGCRLSRARVEIYDHADPAAVAGLLAAHRRDARRALVVTDSVFSMDGDRAPLAALTELCRAHDAWLMVDEAHAVGVLGPGGRGLAAELGLAPEVVVGTLGKAFGAFGAYVIGSLRLRDLLLHRARSFVFSTALPPALAAAGRTAVSLVGGSEGEALRGALHRHIGTFSQGLGRLGLLAAGAGETPIIPLLVGTENAAMEVSNHLLEAGFHVQAIRPPTVPRGTSRLRFALMATHSPEQLEDLLGVLADLLRAGRLVPPRPATPLSRRPR
jgi:8-amino-7-oxononanoate synthase